MIEIPVFYATTEGQTARIAERLAGLFRDYGYASDALEVTSPRASRIEWADVRATIVGASLHMGKHQASVMAFVKEHLPELAARPGAFFSVSLSAASSNREEVAEARRIAAQFCADVGWRPSIVASLGGRLAYTKYGWLKRRMLRRIAAKEGGPTDTSRDHELTDWAAVAALAAEMSARIGMRVAS